MMANTYRYPYNPDGINVECFIENEIHAITDINKDEYQFIILEYSPFFKDKLSIIRVTDGKILKDGIDYQLTHRFKSATDVLKREIYGSITILNNSLIGNIRVSYFTLGGDYTAKNVPLMNRLVDNLLTHRTVQWEDIVDMPPVFPPKYHMHSNDQIKDMDDVVDAIDRIADIISGDDMPSHRHDIAAVNNLQEILDSKIDNIQCVHTAPIKPEYVDINTICMRLSLPGIYSDCLVKIELVISTKSKYTTLSVYGALRTGSDEGRMWETISAVSSNDILTLTVSGSYARNGAPLLYMRHSPEVTGTVCFTVPRVIYSQNIDTLLSGTYSFDQATIMVGNEVSVGYTAYMRDIDEINRRLRRVRLNTLLGENVYDIV